jgi:hypothetical protein
VGDARVQHYLPADRLTARYIWDWWIGAGRTHFRRYPIAECPYFWGAPRWLIRQYLEVRIKLGALSIYKGQAWLKSFCRAAFLKGMILESRAEKATLAPCAGLASGQLSE